MRNHNEQKLNNPQINERSHCEIPSNQTPEVLDPSSPTWTWMDQTLLCNPERNTWDWRELDSGSTTDCKIHKSYLCRNRAIVSNVNVDYFRWSSLLLIVYLQHAACEFFNVKVCWFLIRKDVIMCSSCATDRSLRYHPPPCRSYATSWWWCGSLSCSRSVSKGKTHSRISQQPFPCLLTRSQQVQQLTHEQKSEPQPENRWQKHSPHPFKKNKTTTTIVFKKEMD